MTEKDDLTMADVHKLLDQVADDLPILVAFRLMAECGLKVGQVTTLRSLHVSYRCGVFWLDTGRGQVRCPEDLAFDLLDLESDPALPLVRYDASSLFRHVRQAAATAGVGKKVNTHSLRRYWQNSCR